MINACNLPFPTASGEDHRLIRVCIKGQDGVPSVIAALPEDYKRLTAAAPQGDLLFQPWASFAARDNQLTISIKHARLTRDLGPGDAIQLDLEKQDRRILNRRDQLLAYGLDSDILTSTKCTSGAATISRTAAFKHGQHYVQIEITTEANNYPAQASWMLKILSNTHLEASHEAASEPMAKFEQVTPSSLSFNYPSSWQLYKTESSDTLTHVSLDNLADSQVVGRISVIKSLSDSPEDCQNRLENLLRRQELQLGKVAFLNARNGDGQLRTMGQAVAWDPQGQQVSVSVAFYRIQHALIWLDTVSLTREMAPFWWSVNKRCFEIIVDSLGCD